MLLSMFFLSFSNLRHRGLRCGVSTLQAGHPVLGQHLELGTIRTRLRIRYGLEHWTEDQRSSEDSM